jgi:ankyrin repeat protein
MDTQLLELLLSHAAKYRLKPVSSGEIPFSPLQRAKAKAFVELVHRSEFYYRRICGPSVAEKLASVIDAILEDETMEMLQSMGVSTMDGSPLLPACYRKRNDILTAILHSRPKYSLNDVDSDGMNALLWCGERGNTDGVIKLLQAGADPLVCNSRGYNVFHNAARFAPACLDQVLIAVDRGEVLGSSGLNSMAMVTTRSQNEERMTPFLLALMEGTPEHLKCVENLKRRYGLDYDAYAIPPVNLFGQDNSKALLTPMAYLTLAAVLFNVVTVEQVHYLLQLNPRPKFKADTSGSTLLHFAVCGFYHGKYGSEQKCLAKSDPLLANMNSNSTGYAVLRLLLRTFPGQVHVEAANDAGNTPIHLAAAAANITALEIIQSHLSSRGEAFNVNMRNKRGCTPLDMVGDHQLVKLLKNDYMHKTFRERSESTRSFLRRFHGEEGVGIEEGLRTLRV